MNLTATVLTMLLALPPAYTDKEETNREQRMQTIADAIVHASERAACTGLYDDERCKPIWKAPVKNLATMLITKAWWESRFAKNVHDGKCRPYECDAVERNGVIVHLARSLWQLQRTSYAEPVWSQLEGEDFESTRNAAWVATTILADGMKKCKNERGAMSWYATGRCNWSGAPKRYLTYKKLLTRGSLR